MPYYTMIHLKRGERNLVTEITDDKVRKYTFNEFFDFLQRAPLKRNDAQIIEEIDIYRQGHLEYLRQEMETGRIVNGQMQMTLTVIATNGRWKEVKEYNPTIKRETINLDARIEDYISKQRVPIGDKEVESETLRMVVNYVLVPGR